MIDPIDKIIEETFVYKIDTLHNLSLSSNASMIRYALAYKDFNPNEKYPEEEIESSFELTKKYWKYKIESYKKQDEKAERDTKNNVSMDDFQYYHDLILSSKCKMCGKAFTYANKPTLDRIDNEKPHTKENCQLMCCYCNVVKSNKDEDVQRLRINLRNYALKNNLPMTLDSVEAYHILRNGITGGLSNVQHRVNLKGITHINKLAYNPETKTVSNEDTTNIMTHFVGVDFNSLYPSSFSSNPHDFIQYTDHKMYMPGRLNGVIICDTATKKAKALGIIKKKNTLFVAEVKGHIDEKYINDYINFLPIIRNLDIITDEKTIGSFMYNYMKSNNLPVDQKQRKLTQLASTYNQYQPFSSYYLWYLIDRFHFIIDDIQSILTFTKNTCFNEFANKFMNERQKAELEGNKGKSLFCKISLNGSYGYDAMNTQNYAKTKIMNAQKARVACMSNKFKNIREIGEDTYQVMLKDRFYRCDTCLQEAFFTLDNAKYWYLVFIYDFMYKCMNVNRFHFIEGDTDSSYWAIAGDPNLPNTQAFQAIVTDKQFYDKNIFKFAPFDFFCFDEKFKPKLKNKAEEKAHEKKLLGLAIEKQGDNMVALCPKCYTSFNGSIDGSDFKKIAQKMKGVSLRQNKQLTPKNYLDIINDKVIFDGQNINLQLKNGSMTRLTIGKTALTGAHTKAVCCENGCCMPFI
ncbi:DNA/RNA polymerases family [Trichomonas vaginalis G3]|uniref:DNA/RNA polymerases family n=5 Tax=Trichomonas vaginalis (strain ATCC PRA-98 / G3) TaxID=412133 RepID=UPI0021E58771|nr:DNA/RNA polymerases family [Trichomonas vaginalis G3]KAI5512099.1 DNA/RNA polymerases family [Trichomonas vaginalis G3]